MSEANKCDELLTMAERIAVRIAADRLRDALMALERQLVERALEKDGDARDAGLAATDDQV
jgi:hypothetical protein